MGKSLKSNLVTSDGEVSGINHGYQKILDIEDQLRRSKDAEVELINKNMQMQHKIQDLQLQVKEKEGTKSIESKMKSGDKDKKSKVLPNYYKKNRRPKVIRVVGEALRKL